MRVFCSFDHCRFDFIETNWARFAVRECTRLLLILLFIILLVFALTRFVLYNIYCCSHWFQFRWFFGNGVLMTESFVYTAEGGKVLYVTCNCFLNAKLCALVMAGIYIYARLVPYCVTHISSVDKCKLANKCRYFGLGPEAKLAPNIELTLTLLTNQ